MQVEELTRDALAAASGAQVREAIRTRRWRGTTHDMARGRIPTFTSAIPCVPAGPFQGPMVVSLTPIPQRRAAAVREVTARYPGAQGGPVHEGDPAAIGVDPSRAGWTTACDIAPDEVPMFWGCGVTPQAVALAAGVPEMITHAVGHMFMTDLTLADLRRG